MNIAISPHFVQPGRWPHLARPGPQPHNQIAGTAAEQFRRALGPRPAKPYGVEGARRLAATIRAHPAEIRPALLELLAGDIGALVGSLMARRMAS